MNVFVTDLDTALLLRKRRLLTSSLRYEPTFKHDSDDDPDEFDLSTKKGRKVASFSFERLLPLALTREETSLALDLNLVELRRVGLEKTSIFFDAILRDDKVRGTNGQASRESTPERSSSLLGELTEKDHVFRDLWRRGFCMVDGLKFGVDFLAYAQDPTRHHAEYMVLICANSGDGTSAVALQSNLDLTVTCTVAVKTRKTLLLATVEKGDVVLIHYTKFKRVPVMSNSASSSGGRNTKMAQTEEEILEEIPE